VDGNGTMQKVIKMENAPNCDSVSPTRYQWVIVTGDYMCSGTTKCQKEKEQRSDDFGMTWRDTGNYRAGSVIEYNSVDCGYIPPQYRTVSGTPYCNGYTKMVDTYNQVSYDGGTTWQNTGVSGSTVIEYNSEDCGYVPPTPENMYRWIDTGEYVCEEFDYQNQYLTLDIISDGTIKWRRFGDTFQAISYSLDSGSTWTTIVPSTDGAVINVNAGDIVFLKGEHSSYSDVVEREHHYYASFYGSTAYFNVYGNIMSMISGDSFTEATSFGNYAFYGFFENTNVVNAKNLYMPVMNLTQHCYWNMFQYCTSLKTAPSILPATTLAYECYRRMFGGCTSLETTPTLPATTLASQCYMSMFGGCTSLTTAPELPATILADDCYEYMFNGCTSLTTAPSVLPATDIPYSAYRRMFKDCTSLVTAPEISGITLANGSTEVDIESGVFFEMFAGCINLKAAPSVLPATELKVKCYEGMFKGCISLVTPPVISGTIMSLGSCTSMFEGCTSLTTAPTLSATTGALECYRLMFSGCTSLNYIKCLVDKVNLSYCYHWVDGVAASGTFVKNPNSEWATGTSGIPDGWTVQDAS